MATTTKTKNTTTTTITKNTITTTTTTNSSSSSSSKSFFGGLFVFVCVFLIYNGTMYPSVSGGDSGELAIAACTLAVPHPPGYPLFTMMAHLATRMQWLQWLQWLQWMQWMHGYGTGYTSAASKIHLINAILGASSATMLYATSRRINIAWNNQNNMPQVGQTSTTATITAAMFAILFATMPSVWLYAIQAEVFALNNAACAAILYWTVRYYEAAQQYDERGADEGMMNRKSTSTQTHTDQAVKAIKRAAMAGALACGVAMANQHTAVFYTIPTAIMVTGDLVRKRLLNGRMIGLLVIAIGAGMSTYAYIPWAAYHKHEESWGDQRSIAGFITHFLRQEYGTFQLAPTEQNANPGLWVRFNTYFENAAEEMLYVPLVLCAIGVLACTLKSTPKFVQRTNTVLMVEYTLYIVVFHKLANLDMRPLFLGVQKRFWQQPNMILIIWACSGCFALSQGIASLTRSCIGSKAFSAHFFSNVIGILLVCLQLYARFPYMQHSHDYSVQEYGLRQLNAFPMNSLVLVNGDLNNNAIKYNQQCENIRRDVRIIGVQQMSWPWFIPMQQHNYANVTFPGVVYHPYRSDGFSMRTFLAHNERRFRNKMFLCGPWKDGDLSMSSGSPYTDVPFGFCTKLAPSIGYSIKALLSDLQQSWRVLMGTFQTLEPFNPIKHAEDSWERIIYSDVAHRLVYVAQYTAEVSSRDRIVVEQAYRAYADVIANEIFLSLFGALTAQHYRNAGIIFGMYSADIPDDDKPIALMVHCWQRFVSMVPDDQEILAFLNARRNPYTGKEIPKAIMSSNEFKKRTRLHISDQLT